MKTDTENNQDDVTNASATRDCPDSPGSQISGYRYDHRTNQYIPTINGIDTSPTTFDKDLALRLAEKQIDIANVEDWHPSLWGSWFKGFSGFSGGVTGIVQL